MPQPPDVLENINVLIGRNLRKLRTRYGMSQEQLSVILGVTHQQVQKYESGKNRLPLEKLLLIKEYFGVSYDLLFEKSPTSQSADDCQTVMHQLERMKDPKLRRKIINAVHILCT